MPTPLVLLLLAFWIYMAYRAFSRGDMILAGVFLAVGIALTVDRFSRRQAPPRP